MRALTFMLLLHGALAVPGLALAQTASGPPVVEKSIDQLQAMMASGTSSVAIAQAYLARIAAMDRSGPTLRAVIATNPDAVAQARASDARRKAGRLLGAMDGVPVLIKDNIETKDPIATTAGSLALKDNVTLRDAPLVANLRRQGAVILGKTNLSEWANIRSTHAMSRRAGAQPLCPRPDIVRLVERLGRGGGGELRCGGGRNGDRRVGGVPIFDERAGRAEADARAGQPHARRADQP
jgi:amidase